MCKKINYAKCAKNNRKLELFVQKTIKSKHIYVLIYMLHFDHSFGT